MKKFIKLTVVIFTSFIGVLATPVQAAEEVTLNATATWEGRGTLYQVGGDHVMFVGGLVGIMFAQSGSGKLNSAKIVCPATLDIHKTNGRTTGEGRCIITGSSGNKIFAKWTCAGVAGKGCKGLFVLTAGTGGFQGVSGSGIFVLRTAIADAEINAATGHVSTNGLGLASWSKLKLKLP